MPRKKKQKAKNINRQLSAPEIKNEKSGKKKKLHTVHSAGDVYKYDYDADYESPKKSNSRPTSPVPFFMPILADYGFSWPRRKSPFKSTSSEKNVVSPVSSPDSGFPTSPCQVVPIEEIINGNNTDSSNGILSSDACDSDHEKESDKENFDHVIASLDDIIENEESDEDVNGNSVTNGNVANGDINEEIKSIIFSDEEESETFSVRKFKVKEMILGFEKKKSTDQAICNNNGKQCIHLSTEEIDVLDNFSNLENLQENFKSYSTTSLFDDTNKNSLEVSTKSNSINSLSPIIKDGKGSNSGKKVRFMIDSVPIRKSISCDVLETPGVGEVCEWEVTVKEIDIPVHDGQEKIECPVRNSYQIMVCHHPDCTESNGNAPLLLCGDCDKSIHSRSELGNSSHLVLDAPKRKNNTALTNGALPRGKSTPNLNTENSDNENREADTCNQGDQTDGMYNKRAEAYKFQTPAPTSSLEAKLKRKKVLKNKRRHTDTVISDECFTLRFLDRDNDVEIMAAVKGISLRSAIQTSLERRGLNVNNVNIYVEASKTPLPLECESFLLGGNTLNIKEKESDGVFGKSSSSKQSGGSKTGSISKGSKSSMARRESFFGRSGSGMLEPPVPSKQRRNSLSFPFFTNSPKVANEDIKAQDDGSSVGSLRSRRGINLSIDDTCPIPQTLSQSVSPQGTLSGTYNEGKRIKERSKLTNLFSPSTSKDREKQDQLNELLNNYSTNGIPHMPELLTLGRETQSEKEDLFEMEPHWSSIVENASGLTKRQHDQQEAIWELLQTEINYIKTLRVITDLFLCVILNLQSEGLLSEIKTEQLSNVGEIVCVNCDFWESTLVPVLEEARESRLPLNPSIMRDGFKKFPETFTPYIKYCVEQKSSTDFIKARYAENDLFKTYVVWAESQPQCKRLKLTDLLVKPMQRITKYSLLLQAILRKTEEDKQRRALLEMIASVDKFVSSVNLTLKHRHDQERLASIITKIESYDAVEAPNDESLKYIQEYNTNFDLRAPMPGCSASQTRSLIMQSVLKLKDNASRMDVECLLFTDLLLICKPSKRMEKYKIIKPPMRVDRLIVHELKDKGSFLLIYLNEYHIPISAFTFHADQRAINIWIEHIRKAQDIYRNLSRECKNSEPYFVPVTVEEEVIHVTPLHQPDDNPPDVVISRTIANGDNYITNGEPSPSELLSPHALSKSSSDQDIKSRHFTDSVTKDDRKKHSKVQTSYSVPAFVDNSPDDERLKIPSSNVSSANSDSSLPDIVDDNLKAKINQRRSSRSEKRYHTADAIQDLNRIDDKDNSIYKRLSWNFGTTDQNEERQGVLKHKIQSSDSLRSIHSSSGVSSTNSLHLSPEGDICEESDYNTSDIGTIYESRHSEDDYHDISEHDRTKSKSTTDIAILFKELTTSERKDGISSVDLPTMDKNKYSSTHLLKMKRQLLLSADVEAR
ncbi:pleckstrin homology domain-containing family G member 5-like isoform X3 [Mytilus trossulus]|uniref:pleckstrin homology domain-containing family G member 5-like isoform X3 n=1 Tax=Mytilus trossulus TaxID=6551 RepID=UPI0030060109